MSAYLQELFAHQEWADAEHWRAFEGHAVALDDKAIRERLFHIHVVQHAFLWVTGARSSRFDLKKIEDFSTPAALKQYAMQGNAELRSQLRTFSPESLEEDIVVPWFQPALTLSRRHALTQAAMHSHYHRGQNATRLRELGGIPPSTDFIVWIRNGKPQAKWS